MKQLIHFRWRLYGFLIVVILILVVVVLIIASENSVAQSGRTLVEPNRDRPGMDYRNFDLSEARPELCQTACESDPRCKAYTYVKPGVQGPQARCWLKSGVPNAVANECCISGVKNVTVATPPPPSYNLTGTWSADDRGLYYIRQLNDLVWWVGMSTESPMGLHDFRKGIAYTNVFRGRLRGNTIVGDWADVPHGSNDLNGTLTLRIVTAPIFGAPVLQKQAQTGGFGASTWNLVIPTNTSTSCDNIVASSPDIRCKFNQVRKNGGHTLYDELKPEKDNVVAFGKVVPYKEQPHPSVGMSYSLSYGKSFQDFLFAQLKDGAADGDIAFYLKLYRSQDGAWPSPIALDQQPNFWSEGWLYPRGAIQIKNKLDYKGFFKPGWVFYSDYYGKVHPEVLMYGRPGHQSCLDPNTFPSECEHWGPIIPPDGGLPLLPGWMENGANSVLWNGRPINGFVLQGPDGTVTIGGAGLPEGTNVRITGVLNLDCGHGITNDCADDDPADEHNVEIHPVYSIDVLQDWTQSRPNADLTGVWAATDVGTYYVRQVGNTVWWLGLSRDRGRTFANVFHGSILSRGADGEPLARPIIEGDWADVPIGENGSMNDGQLRLGGSFCVDPFNVHLPCDVSGPVPQWNILETNFTKNGIFGGYRWQKLYDRTRPSGPVP